MISFYINNNLLINIKNKKPNKIIKNSDTSILYLDDELVGLNIFNPSELNLEKGIVYLTEELINKIKKMTDIDLSTYPQNNFVVAKIIECEKINETHLSKCSVEIDNKEIVQIVCGAPNAKKGLITVCAKVGSIMPSGMEIKSGKLMNNDSNGMLCSYKELNIQQENSGIIELSNDWKVGQIFKTMYANLK